MTDTDDRCSPTEIWTTTSITRTYTSDPRMGSLVSDSIMQYHSILSAVISAARVAERKCRRPFHIRTAVSLRGASVLSKLQNPATDIDVYCRLQLSTGQRTHSSEKLVKYISKSLAGFTIAFVNHLGKFEFVRLRRIKAFSWEKNWTLPAALEGIPSRISPNEFLPNRQELEQAFLRTSGVAITSVLPSSSQLRVLDVGISVANIETSYSAPIGSGGST